MLLHRAARGELLGAKIALVRPLPRMSAHVHREKSAATESLGAVIAVHQLLLLHLACVHAQMVPQVILPRERLLAHLQAFDRYLLI